MNHLPFDELRRRCQKPGHRYLGNSMARRVTRPAALHITRVVAPWGISANLATLAAWGCGVAAGCCFAWGTPWGWILGAVLLQTWYLLDHVDGQLARLRGTASLDGVQLDYLMHHTINLLVPLGIGAGLFGRTAEPIWLVVGLVCGLSLLVITLQHDARYKAFIQRLKRVDGRLEVIGGGGGRPEPQPPVPRTPGRLLAWTARKTCEIHVIANLLALAALGQLILGDARLIAGSACLAVITAAAVAVACWSVFYSQHSGTAEREFAAWFRPRPGEQIVFLDGWWCVREEKTNTASSPPPEKSNNPIQD